jgi:hypothetical protein
MTGMALVGAGNGLAMPQLIRLALVRVRVAQAGVGSAVLATAQQFAGATGVAISGAIFFGVLGSGVTTADHARAMGWDAVIFLILIGIVTGLVVVNGRIARQAA